tara:strand:+ start:786 stop:1133 length:348 start_codon:yes stop_codon:yes gene_type:complete
VKRISVKLNNWVIAKDAVIADTFISRARGLMFRKDLSDFDGMLIAPCNSIHTVGMLFSIDVVFLNKKFEVIKIIENLKPYRMTRPYFKAFQVLELAAGTLANRLKCGDQLEITHV